MASNGQPGPSARDRESLEKLLNASLFQRVTADKWLQLTQKLLSYGSSQSALSDILLDKARLERSLSDPLFLSYIGQALKSKLLIPSNVLRSLSTIVGDIPPGLQVARYPLLRIIGQALAVWRPSPQAIPQDAELLWNIEQILNQSISVEEHGEDSMLFMEVLEAWKHLLTSQYIRPLFKSEKKGNSQRWTSFEGDLQRLREAAVAKLPAAKSTEFERILADFLLALSTADGLTSSTPLEIPKLPVLKTRGSLMRECYAFGATDEIWGMINRLSFDSSPQEVISAIIVAAFDALTIVVKRNDPTFSPFPDPITEVSLYQSIVINRLPAFFAARREQYPLTKEQWEYMALEVFSKIDPVLMNLNLPSIPNLEGDDTQEFAQKDFRQDFMYALVKFDFLDPETPSRILGIQIEEMEKLKEVTEIVEEASGDGMDEQGGIEKVIRRLSNLDGNQSVIVSAILELIQIWISSHDMHPLSVLCTELMKDVSIIDQIFLHTSIPSLVEPLRDLLDNWTIDEEDDNGEHQLIYEQYNSILFLICYCAHHFGRNNTFIDPDGPGFVRTWLREFSKAKWLDMLSDEDSNAIGIWITALFDGDGISDDLVRMSPPYKWLLISTTLFQQSVSAYRQGVLQLKTLKDGFEYFMQSFLEPCLLGAIHYLTMQMKLSTQDTILAYLEILSSLLEFLSPLQAEEDLFSTVTPTPKNSRVLQIIAPSVVTTISQLSLEQTMRAKHLLDPIVETLRPYSSHLRQDISMSRKGVIATLRDTLSTLAQWSAGSDSGFVIPQGVDMRFLPAAVRAWDRGLVIRHIINEMWGAERSYGHHAEVIAAVLLTVPFDVGFGQEHLGEKFVLMMPVKPPRNENESNLKTSLDLLTNLVKTVIQWKEGDTEEKKEQANEDEMQVD